jgi:phage gp45-like
MAALTCTITLDKAAGVVVKIEGGSAPQTITLDGTTLTLEVGGTKIVQTTTDVTIHCTTFTVEATGDVSIKAGAALKLAGVTEADLGAAMVKVEADSMATIKGNLISAQGQLVKLG